MNGLYSETVLVNHEKEPAHPPTRSAMLGSERVKGVKGFMKTSI
jgi:hypothetical protein